jgi:mRNA-degrading endonuclease YafQ of YafQ-DinJ toxin-antitoxin module
LAEIGAVHSRSICSKLKTHKLSGKLKELWSFSVDYDERILFYFIEDEKAVFVDIGSHDEVY